MSQKNGSKKFHTRPVVVLISVVVFLGIAFMFGVINRENAENNPMKQFVGAWSAAEYALDSERYTGYLKMDVKKNGEFSIYDGEAGNPGISGVMSVTDGENIKVVCSGDDFDSPWEGLKETDYLTYYFNSDNEVKLMYGETTIVFLKEET